MSTAQLSTADEPQATTYNASISDVGMIAMEHHQSTKHELAETKEDPAMLTTTSNVVADATQDSTAHSKHSYNKQLDTDTTTKTAHSTKQRHAVQRIIDLYTGIGEGADYIGESVTQTQHALQAAYMAKRAGAEETTILASLLHDCGHLIGLLNHNEHMADLGIKCHESIGADWCRSLGLSEDICILVERHVDAKRYLCHANPKYMNKLSAASRGTLDHQGGPMSQSEAERFDQDPLKKTILLMRTWDDAAKLQNVVVPDIQSYSEMIAKYVQ